MCTRRCRPRMSCRSLRSLLMLGLLCAGCGGGASSLEKRVDALIRRNLASQAVELVRADLARSPRSPRLLSLLGRARLATGDLAGADSSFGQACALDTTYFEGYVSSLISQGSTWVQDSRRDLADAAFRTALARNPGAGGQVAAALVTGGSGLLPTRPDEADQAFETAFQYDTTSRKDIARAYFDGAKAELQAHPRAAAADLERALAWDATLGGEVATVVSAAVARGDSVLDALMPLVHRLDPGSRAAFSRQVAGRRHAASVTVAGRDGWAACPIDLAVGDTLILEPAGEVRAEAGRDGWISEPCGPKGWSAKSMGWWEDGSGGLLATRHPRMALVARVGAGSPFAVPGRLIVVTDVAGPLRLAVNDVPARAREGSGSFTVRIEAPMSAARPAGARAQTAEGR
jgi:hypothetical protein